MIIKLWKIVHKQIEKDVKFPIYREHTLSDDCVLYTRIDQDLTAITISEEYSSRNNYTYELEYESKYRFDRSNVDYHLGLNEHALTEEEFNIVFGRMVACIDRLKKCYLTK